MTTIKLNSTTIYYELHGQGEPILFLHGLGSCGADWLLQIPVFSTNFQVITPDLPGHGGSCAQLTHLTINNIASDMAALLEALDIKSAHIVGLSFGSFVAMQLALDYPEKVKSLVLAGSTCCIRDMGYFSLMSRNVLIHLLPISFVAHVTARLCFPKKEQSVERMICQRHLASVDKSVYIKLFTEIMKFDVAKQLSTICCPVLVIAGLHDKLLPKRHAEKMHTLLRTSKLEVIENAGHVMPIDSPEAFNSLVLHFLQNLSHSQ